MICPFTVSVFAKAGAPSASTNAAAVKPAKNLRIGTPLKKNLKSSPLIRYLPPCAQGVPSHNDDAPPRVDRPRALLSRRRRARPASRANASGRAVVAIRNATIVTVTKRTIQNGTIVLRGGTIAAIGQNVRVPAGADVVDATRRFVSPGIIDCHSRSEERRVGKECRSRWSA